MVDPRATRRLLYRSLYAALAALILLLQVLPLDTQPARWPGPDFLMALTFAFALRRPDYVPPLLVGAVFLVADLLLQQPPGLFAALMVLALEVIRARAGLWRELPPLAEWGVVAVLIAAVSLGYWLVQALLVVAQAPLGLYLIEVVATALVYPPVAVGTVWLLRVRRPAPGSTEAMEGRA